MFIKGGTKTAEKEVEGGEEGTIGELTPAGGEVGSPGRGLIVPW